MPHNPIKAHPLNLLRFYRQLSLVAHTRRRHIDRKQGARQLPIMVLLLSILSLAYSPSSIAFSYWDLYCKQSGVSNVNYNCHPAEPEDWEFEGGIYALNIGAHHMDSEAAVIQSLKAQSAEKHDFCISLVVYGVDGWRRFLNNNVRESHTRNMYRGWGVDGPNGSCTYGGTDATGDGFNKTRIFTCPPGEQGPFLKDPDGSERFCAAMVSNNKCEENPSTPDPISIADGEKHFRNLVDAPVLGQFLFKRSYSSRPSYSGSGILNPQREKEFTTGWRLSYEASVFHTTDSEATVDVYTVDIPGRGQYSYVEQASGEMEAKQNDTDSLTRLNSGELLFKDSSATQWQWLFDTDGRLQSIHRPTGDAISLQYDAQDRLSGATDTYGRTLQIELNTDGVLEQVTAPDGGVFRYEFDDMDRLESIWTPDSTTQPFITYLHEDQNRHGLITGIIGADGVLSKSFTYDENGSAIRSVRHGDGGTEVGSYDLDFSSLYAVAVTDPLGTTRTYNFQNSTGGKRLIGVDQPGGSGCNPSASAISYDTQGLKASEKDFNGHQNCYTYDSTRRLLTSKIEGIDGSANCSNYTASSATLPDGARRITYRWHPQLQLKTGIAEPGVITTIVYNGQPDPFNGGAIASCAPADALLPDGSPIAIVCRRVKQATLDSDGSQGFDATIDSNQ